MPYPKRKLVNDVYDSITCFAVYGRHCFQTLPGDPSVAADHPAFVRVSRTGWTKVSSLDEAAKVFAHFKDLCSMEGIGPKDEPGGFGLIANARGEVTHHLASNGRCSKVLYLGMCGDVVADKPAPTSLFSLANDEDDEGSKFYPSSCDAWASKYSGELR